LKATTTLPSSGGVGPKKFINSSQQGNINTAVTGKSIQELKMEEMDARLAA
jgi:hypothetical protein